MLVIVDLLASALKEKMKPIKTKEERILIKLIFKANPSNQKLSQNIT